MILLTPISSIYLKHHLLKMNIYISGLSYGTDEAALANRFSEFGEITSARVITDRESGRSRGFGFIEMSNDDDARKAIDALNETEFEGRTIYVKEAMPREERPCRSFNNDRRRY
uniref:RNA-binding protein n=1 Tax=Prevotella sp. GTC17254 TaxID=3236794 RepID=A0AB33IV93_9BACT